MAEFIGVDQLDRDGAQHAEVQRRALIAVHETADLLDEERAELRVGAESSVELEVVGGKLGHELGRVRRRLHVA